MLASRWPAGHRSTSDESGMGVERRTATLAAIEHRWREILAQKQLENVGFRVQEEEELPVDPKTGKFRLVVRAPRA